MTTTYDLPGVAAPEAPTVTGKMEIITADERLHFEWADEDGRAAARLAFEQYVALGALAMVWTEPHRSFHVRSFDEVEQYEREHGEVAVTLTPQVRGG